MSEIRAEHQVAVLLTERAETLAVVEASSGGLIASRLTAIPGSSAWFIGGVVAYSAESRRRWLGIEPEATRQIGSVSAEAALVLARAAREVLRTTWAVAETGIAGPQVGRRSSKPVGLTYVAVAGLFAGQNVERVVEVFTGLGEREGNRRAFADAALSLLLACLEQLSEGST